MTADLKQTDKTTISCHAERGSYDRDAANAILDEGMVAHVGFDAGAGVIVIPMTYARMGDELVLHGAVASRWLSSFEKGRPVSVCVTLLDGLVLAQSAFSHSMNYRSVVCFGTATVVTDEEKKSAAFKAFANACSIAEVPYRRAGDVGLRKVVKQSRDDFQMIGFPNVIRINPRDQLALRGI